MRSLFRRSFIGVIVAFVFVVSVVRHPARADDVNVACNTAALTAAIGTANGTPEPDTLNLAAGCTYSFSAGDVTFPDSALPPVGSDITINGSGATITRADGSPTFRLLYTVGASVTLSNLTVTGGDSDVGGGFYNAGTLTVINSTITGNSAVFGGGFYNAGTLTVINSTVSGNSATNDGGGIVNEGTVTVINSTIVGNSATNDGGGIINGDTVTVTNSTISGNSAGSNGGGIDSDGALTVINSTISGNSAVFGGGIDNTGTLTVTNSIVWGNSMWDGSSQIESSGSPAVTFSDVEGGFAGAGNLNADPLFVGPVSHTLAPTVGGNYHIQPHSPALDTGHSGAASGTDIDGGTRILYGAVDMGSDEVDYCPAYVFPYTVAAEDTADLSRAVRCANANSDANTINLTASTYTFSAGDVTNNDSALPPVGSDITINGSGATIAREDGSPTFRLLYVLSGASVTLRDLTVTGGNSAENIGGGVVNEGTLTMINSTIAGNSGGNGGGIHNFAGTLTLINSTITGNSAAEGGGIYSSAAGTLTVTNSTIAGNRASLAVDYGAIYSLGSLTMTNSIVWGNSWFLLSQIGPSGGPGLTYNDVEGGLIEGTGNLNVDPLFVSPVAYISAPTTAGDYRLQADSPALNVGSNAALPVDTYDLDGDSNTAEPLPIDLDGSTRVVNATVDMGAFEHQTAAAVVVSETNVDVAESGATDTYSVHLASRPAGDVTITPAGDANCTVSAALTFTDADWDTPQNVTVTAIDDAVAEGDHDCTVTNTASSADPGYDLISVASIDGSITDNDAFTFELLANGGFESDMDGWTVKNKTGDKRTCKQGKALNGLCAFKFAGAAGEKAQLSQTVDLSGTTFASGDTLTLSAWFKGNNATAKTQMVLFVRYTGNPTPVQTKLVVKRNAAYTQHNAAEYALTSGAVDQIKATFKHKSTAGSVLIDDTSLIHTTLAGRSDVPLPPPGAPDGFRGGN